ncbi:MAG: gamma-glutamyltransferase [Clostridia bacterium]|nr:gamma-glutamyltransferase [Clostridia bacterium]
MEKRKPQKQNNKGLVIFTCIALALAIGLGSVVYLPKLLNKGNDPYAVTTPVPVATDAIVTTDPSGNPIVITPEPTDKPQSTESVVVKNKYAVSCSNPDVSNIGMQVLENGGNAVDAAVAMAFALGVLEPYASGIGGGGGMLVRDPSTGECMFYDYRDAAGENINSTLGKTGVPGFVAGMELVHQKYGRTAWGNLLQPSIEYAENGFAISASFARHLQSSRSKLSSRKNPQFYNGSRLLVEGETIYQRDLAETYRMIQRYGSSVFYHGAITEHMIEATKLTQEDFDNYAVCERKPVTGTYKGYMIVSAPAPFSGTTLIQMLEIAEKIGFGTYDDDIVRYGKIMASLSSVTLKDRRKNICDPAYHTVPANLLTEDHIENLTQQVRDGSSEYIEPDDEHESTTHISVIDADGMMVSVTNTLSDFFGLGVYVDGFFLNDTMVTSSSDTSARNYCVRGQRPRSFAMPTFILGEDGLKVALGSSGGDRIPQVVMQIIVRFFNGETLQEACDRPRIVMDGYYYYIEDASVIDPNNRLQQNGFYKLAFSSREYFGAFNAVGANGDGTTFGASDVRRNGSYEVAEGDDGHDS